MILFLSSDYPGLVSISSRRSVLGVAILAVDRAALSGLERNFAFLLAVGADSFVHLSGASVETAPLITQFFHSSFGNGQEHPEDSLASLLGLQHPSY